MQATEADVGGKGQKDGVGKLEKKARNYLIDSCLHLWMYCRGTRTPNATHLMCSEIRVLNLPRNNTAFISVYTFIPDIH